MTTHQRRRGLPAKLFPVVAQEDRRGNKVLAPDLANPVETRVWIFPQRGARAELPGQMEINVIRIGTAHNLGEVGLWARVEMLGSVWDVVTPPAYHHGTRHTRHWSMDLRERP
jgi:hypothetical protein